MGKKIKKEKIYLDLQGHRKVGKLRVLESDKNSYRLTGLFTSQIVEGGVQCDMVYPYVKDCKLEYRQVFFVPGFDCWVNDMAINYYSEPCEIVISDKVHYINDGDTVKVVKISLLSPEKYDKRIDDLVLSRTKYGPKSLTNALDVEGFKLFATKNIPKSHGDDIWKKGSIHEEQLNRDYKINYIKNNEVMGWKNKITKVFGNISAKPANYEKFKDMYIFPTKNAIEEVSANVVDEEYFDMLRTEVDTDGNAKVLNKGYRFSQRFVEYLINSLNDGNTPVHLIKGFRGIGKTAFVNFLLSTFHKKFDKNKVIAIRVDLTRYEYWNYKLQEVLHIKTIQILLDQYLDGGKAIHLRKDFDTDESYNYYLKKSKSRKKTFAIGKIIAFIKTYYNEADFNELSLNELLRGDVFETNKVEDLDRIVKYILLPYMKSISWRFIFIIDGMDDATRSLQKREMLVTHWKDGLVGLLERNNDFTEGQYLVCARDESYVEISEHLRGEAVPRRSIVSWKILPVRFSCMIEKRKDYLLKANQDDPRLCTLFVRLIGITNIFILYGLRIACDSKNIKVISPNVLRKVEEHLNYLENSNTSMIHESVGSIYEYFYDLNINFFELISSLGNTRAVLNMYRSSIVETLSLIDERYRNNNINITIDNIVSLDVFSIGFIKQKAYRIWSLIPQSSNSEMLNRTLNKMISSQLDYSSINTYKEDHEISEHRIIEILPVLVKQNCNTMC